VLLEDVVVANASNSASASGAVVRR
jgi:hypothetical protein